jgi:pilus assembly protein CpaB
VTQSPSPPTSRRALILALVSAAVGTGLLALYLDRFERTATGGPRVAVLTVADPLRRGDALADDKLGTREVPQAYLEDRAVLATDRAKVLGLRLAGSAKAGQSLLWSDLALDGDAAREPSSLVPAGSRAMTLRVGPSLVKAGDAVDVIANLPGADGISRSAVVVVQRVRALAVAAESITVGVTLREAQILALAEEQGSLQVVLRNPEDGAEPADAPEVSIAALVEPPRRGAPARHASGPIRLQPGVQ